MEVLLLDVKLDWLNVLRLTGGIRVGLLVVHVLVWSFMIVNFQLVLVGKMVQIKKTTYILVAVLVTNIILSMLVRNLSDGAFEAKVLLKLFMAVSVFMIIWKFDSKMLTFSKGSIIYVLISLVLISISFFRIQKGADEGGFEVHLYDNLLFMTSCILVGVFEELLFRVFVFNSILENNHKRIFSTMWVTSILFGLAHLSNLFYTDVVRLSILVQVLFAVGIGFLLQAVYLRTKSILFCISLHALVNYFGSYKSELYKIVDLDNLTYNFQDFLMSAGLILIFSGVFLIPLGYVLVRPILKKDL